MWSHKKKWKGKKFIGDHEVKKVDGVHETWFHLNSLTTGKTVERYRSWQQAKKDGWVKDANS